MTEVRTRTLANLFEQYQAPDRFHLLTIDVEGHDSEVLSSFDLSRYRPILIVIEMTDFKMEDLQSHRISRYLLEHGYRMHGFVTMNGYFIDQSFRLGIL